MQELEHPGVGFVSLTEALDLTTPAGRAMACWPSLLNSSGRFSENAFGLAWRTHVRMASAWASR